MQQAIEAARRQAEERATAEIMALEEDLEREREQAARSLEEVQRRLEEAEARAAGNVRVTDTRAHEQAADWLREQGGDVRRELEAELERGMLQEAGEQLDAEMRRLQAESDIKIEAALAKVEAETQARMEREANRRLAEQEEQLRAEAEERVRATTQTVRQEIERRLQDEIQTLRTELEEERASRERLIERSETRAKQAEAKVQDVEMARLAAEADARTAAAEWVRVQTRALQREGERGAKERIPAARSEAAEEAEDDTAEQEAIEPDEPKVGFLRRRAEKRRARHAEKAAQEKEAAQNDAERETEAHARAARERKKRAAAAKKRAQSKHTAKDEKTAGRAKTSSGAKATEAKPAKAAAKPRRRSGPLDVNKATFEQFRELGMSVTQATRVIAYREREDGFASVDDLDTVPGLPEKLMSEIRDQLTA
jgi:DNA uptake protein ComE-like DNA-binding protein